MSARLARTRKTAARSARRSRAEGRVRAVIDRVLPEIDGGRFPVKRIVGDTMVVEADVFGDGHDMLACMLGYRHESEVDWHELPMTLTVNDRWRGEFPLEKLGRYRYTVTVWVDHFLSWRHDFKRRIDPADIASAALVGGKLIAEAANRADRADAQRLRDWGKALIAAEETDTIQRIALDETLAGIAERYPDRRFAAVYDKELKIVVDTPRARFSSWYELFPRSVRGDGRHGTFRDVEARLSYMRELGFDILYLPPIHPIGRAKRKGKNNSLTPDPTDVGSTWAIGSEEGGHKAVHPELGSLEDFRHLVATAREMGIEVALDIAFQCAPDHPYVKTHPEWFTWRPDGTVQYAENPPKKYQDIYPFNFESEDWTALWEELKSIFEFWIDQGVTIFRVDNPHTKP
ncbi:MAG: maltotransferase domain-containing protein, partial [Burkholderiales bacterium]